MRYLIKKFIKYFNIIFDYLFKGIIFYKVKNYEFKGTRLPLVSTGWKGNELVIADIIDRFKVIPDSCLEFGVEFGFSTAVFATYFNNVTGVDTFEGDIHTNNYFNYEEIAKNNLLGFNNIRLIKNDYKDFIKENNSFYNLIHVDIVHTYEDTFKCGLWSAMHSDCTLFHDTESFPEVKKAVYMIAKKTGKKFYNYPYKNGLGILV